MTVEILSIASSVLDSEIDGIRAVKDSLSDTFIQCIDLIEGRKGRVVVSGIGKSGIIARKIAATLSSTGAAALYVNALEASHGDLGMIVEGDVVILLSNSGNSLDLNYIIEYCHRFLIPIIGITRNKDSDLARNSSVALILPNISEASPLNAPTTSTTMMLALGDAIAVTLYTRKGFSKEDFKDFHPGGSIGAALLKVSDLMHTGDDMPLVSQKCYASDAILEMVKKRLGCVGIISDAGGLAGIFTAGDLMRNISIDFKSIKISDIMISTPIVIDEGLLAAEALGIMNQNGVTVLFVLRNAKPAGVLHMHDILKMKVV